jgi:tRNA threonylcarbamoyladenosine biosynthesis protein TsaB
VILSIETATRICAAALVHQGAVVAERHEEGRAIHAGLLPALVEEVLGGHRPEELEGIAVSIGPGSFTGLRIGLSFAKGLSYACSVPILAVPTLEAIATKALRSGAVREGDTIVPVLDARRDEVYYQFFRMRAGSVASSEPPADVAVNELLSRLAGMPATVTGEAAFRLQGGVTGDPASTGLRFLGPPEASCDAGIVGMLGELLFAAGKVEERGTLEPRYIKEFFLRTPATTDR